MTIESEFLEPIEQYFLDEALDLLQTIEQTLLNLLEEKTTEKVHTLMRSAHTLKGSAANCELKTIETIAHHLEDVFQALYPHELDIDPELGSLLLEGYECLKTPLNATLSDLPYDEEEILDQTAAVFAQLQTKLGDFFGREAPLPSAEELGFDIVGLIFADSVPQDLQQLETAIASEKPEQIQTVLRDKAEFFQELGISYELPGLAAVGQSVITAIEQHPEQVIFIAQAALDNFQQAVEAILSGDRTQGGEVSDQLSYWTENAVATDAAPNFIPHPSSKPNIVMEEEDLTVIQASPEAEFDSSSSTTAELLTMVDNFEDTNLAVEEDLTIIQASPEAEFDSSSSTTEELLTMVDNFEDTNLAVEEDLTVIQASPEAEFDSSSSTTEELLTMVDNFEDTNPAVEEDLTVIQASPEAEFASSSSTTEELLTMVDNFEDTNLAVEEDLTVIQASPEAEFASSSSTTEELLTMVDNFEDTNPAVEEVEPTSELESRSAELSSISLRQEPAIGNGSEVNSPMERILQSIFRGDWDTAAPKSQPTTSEKAQKSSSPSIKPPEALPTIRVTVQELDRLSHSIGELLISENQQHLQSDQIHRLTQDTLEQFLNCQQKLNQIHDWSDHNLLLSESKRRQQQRITNRQKNAIFSSSWTQSPQTLTIVEGIPSTDFQPEFDVLEMDVYSDLHLLLQNLTEQMMHLGEQIEALDGFAQNFRFNLGKRKQLLSGAQEDLLQARMLPLATVLNRFPRMLQQMIASHQKPAELKLIGSEVLIDKVVVEKLYDPLLHLIRNAYDHGLESSDIRRQQNKSEAGNITIRAYHQGNCTTIEVSDDGQGLNWESIRTKAIAKKLLTREQAASASEAQLAEILFEPGFSTADKISQLSGRGIGLDVVRSQLQPLQGSISVNSVLGQGTTFVLKFPINLTSARLLICESQGIVYALLSEVIDRVLLPQPDQIQHQQSKIGQNQQNFLCWGDKLDQQLIPIDPLNNLIDYQYPTFFKEKSTSLSIFPVKPKNSVKPLLMLKHQQQRLCLQVDQILVEQELVIKSFGNTITLPNYIQGYSVLGDGSLTLVIDLAVLVTQTGETNFRANSLRPKFSDQTPTILKPVVTVEEEQLTPTSEDESSQIFNRNQPSSLSSSKKVLVVDDSVVQRQTLTQHLTKANYKVLQAGNGQEALAQLNQHAEDIQLVICDVEMPYMNGFEFLSHWREDTRFAKIPVIMLTTRSGQKHRRLALALGAKVYFTKPYSNQELVETIAQLIEQP